MERSSKRRRAEVTSPSSSPSSLDGTTASVAIPSYTTENVMEGIAKVKSSLECAVCRDYICVAHALPCSHLFCRECILNWLKTPRNKKYQNCPECRAPIKNPPTPVPALDNLLEVLLPLILDQEEVAERNRKVEAVLATRPSTGWKPMDVEGNEYNVHEQQPGEETIEIGIPLDFLWTNFFLQHIFHLPFGGGVQVESGSGATNDNHRLGQRQHRYRTRTRSERPYRANFGSGSSNIPNTNTNTNTNNSNNDDGVEIIEWTTMPQSLFEATGTGASSTVSTAFASASASTPEDRRRTRSSITRSPTPTVTIQSSAPGASTTFSATSASRRSARSLRGGTSSPSSSPTSSSQPTRITMNINNDLGVEILHYSPGGASGSASSSSNNRDHGNPFLIQKQLVENHHPQSKCYDCGSLLDNGLSRYFVHAKNDVASFCYHDSCWPPKQGLNQRTRGGLRRDHYLLRHNLLGYETSDIIPYTFI